MPIRIGGFSAFWGDTPGAASQIIRRDRVDYLIGDYLAEVTLCLLAKIKQKNHINHSEKQNKHTVAAEQGGYVNDFVNDVWVPLMADIIEQDIKIITNAGGMNPLGLKVAIEREAKKAGIPCPQIAIVLGDDITDKVKHNTIHLDPFSVCNETEQQWTDSKSIMSSNVYIGAAPIAEALNRGAQIVITGRCVDSALVLGILLYEFRWNMNEYHLLSSGSLAGHIIECGCQCTGGNFTDWELTSAGYHDMGFPIVECSSDGTFIVTKPYRTGGIVSIGTVSEQLVYEIGDPMCYMLPDVCCDWSEVTLTIVNGRKNAIKVQGARGRKPTEYLKVGTTCHDGYMSEATLLITGFDARKKSEIVGKSIIRKTERMMKLKALERYVQTRLEYIGTEDTYNDDDACKYVRNGRELILRISVHHSDYNALKIFQKEIAPCVTSMVPGITGLGSGRPKITPFIKYYSSLVHKRDIPIFIQVGQTIKTPFLPLLLEMSLEKNKNYIPSIVSSLPTFCTSETLIPVPLIALCYARSGDKGNHANIGIVARNPIYYNYLIDTVTTEIVKQKLKHFIKGTVIRYELPGIYGLNFLCLNSLNGGGLGSLNIDKQGKTYGQKILSMIIYAPVSFVKDSPYQNYIRCRM